MARSARRLPPPAVLAGLVATALLVTGCSALPGRKAAAPSGSGTPSPTATASATPTPTPTPAVTEVWRTSGDPFSGLRAAGGYGVGLEKDGRKLQLVGLDPASGKRLWKQEASPGSVPPGIAVGIAVVVDGKGRELVAYQRPVRTRDLTTRVVAADPATGKDVATSIPLLVASRPAPCADGKDVCFSAFKSSARALVTRRLRLSDGKLLTEDDGSPPGTEPIGDHGLVRFFSSSGTERLGRVADGKLVWSRTPEEMFGRNFTSTRGWIFSYYPDLHAFIGSIGGPAKLKPGSQVEIRSAELQDGATASFDERTGKRLWRDQGSSWHCGGGLYHPSRPAADRTDAGDSDPGLPVRCRMKGHAVPTKDLDALTITGLDVVVEGLDPRTGKTTWTLPLGEVPDMDSTSLPSSDYLDQSHASVPAESGTLILDLTSGEHRPAGTDDLLACTFGSEIDYVTPWVVGKVKFAKRFGGGLFETCNGDGDTVDEPPPTALLDRFAARGTGDLAMLAVDGGWAGYRAG